MFSQSNKDANHPISQVVSLSSELYYKYGRINDIVESLQQSVLTICLRLEEK